MPEAMDITAEKQRDGSWLFSTIYGNQYYKRKYMGYTKKEGLVMFRRYVKSEDSFIVRERS